jgi:hypothetical protein
MKVGTWVRYVGDAWADVNHYGKVGFIYLTADDYVGMQLTDGQRIYVYPKHLTILRGEDLAVAIAMAAFKLRTPTNTET